MMEETKKRRSALRIMGSLIGLVKPLLHIMLAAIVLGTAGYLCAIFLTILAGQLVVRGLLSGAAPEMIAVKSGWLLKTPVDTVIAAMLVLAVLRGILHYAEQYCNHFIAFQLLAIIRHQVFAALRKLCPARLEGRDKGNLISMITTDIELLEVFYAHTISPIAIAVCASFIMVLFIGSYHWLAGLWALVGYLLVGVAIPLWNNRQGGQQGMEFRTAFGELNSFVLDSLRGLDETIQYGQGEQRNAQMAERSGQLAQIQSSLNRMEGRQRSFTNLVILLASFGMLGLTVSLYDRGAMGFEGVLTCTIAMMGSFGPVVALSNLSNNLHQTLASGERVLSLLEEQPLVEEIPGEAQEKEGHVFAGASLAHVTFAYEEIRTKEGGDSEEAAREKQILRDVSLVLEPGKITGIHGASGSGKSTILKLLMRFWDIQQGTVRVDGADVRQTPTRVLRDMESYVTQETHLFHDSIANNIGLAKPGAGREEIMEAAKKASIHDFIMTLPKGYDTEVGELGDTLSGGEKQRIGVARAFLHDAPLMLLDEPTSNLDSLNEGIILRALKEQAEKKTVILVSHRASTMRVAEQIIEMNTERIT